ncbi:MAG: sigma-E factor regulatory protein RseB domain-containing protein [Vicinamibacterales bacterium]
MMRLLTPLLLAVLGAASTAEAAPTRARLTFDERLDAPVMLTSLSARPAGLRVGVRLHMSWTPSLDPAAWTRVLDERVRAYAASDTETYLVLELQALDEGSVDAWKQAMRTVADRAGPRLAGVDVVAPPSLGARDLARLAFYVKTTSTELRTVDGATLVGLTLGVATPASELDALFAEDLAPYVDAISLDGGAVSTDRLEGAIDEVDRALARLDPTAAIWLGGLTAGESPGSKLSETVVGRVGSRVSTFGFAATPDAPAVLRASGELVDLLSGDIVELDEREAGLELDADGRSAGVRRRLLFNTTTFATYLAVWPGPENARVLTASLRLTSDVSVLVREPGVARRAPPGDARKEADGRARVTWAPRDTLALIDFNAGATETFALRDEVADAARPTVEEIVARHRQVLARQDRALDHYVALVRMEQHFRPTMTDPGYDVVSENRYFFGRDGVEWEELSFAVNGTKWGPDRPAFPLLQAEKVLSLPLDLRLTSDYRYTLEGDERVGGRTAYVVRFDPVDSTRSLYRGRMWIDAATFARLKVQAVQTRLGAPVVSNEEIQVFDPVADGRGGEFRLFTKLTSRQIVLIAGRNLLVEREVSFRDFQINTEAFAESRERARAGDRIMYRETDRGLRYFAKENGRRVVSARPTTSAKAMAMGVTVDPSFDFPLPIFGINYLDFEFGGPDRQLALLFGGVLAFGNIQAPKLFGTRVDGSVDFSGIAVPSSDRVFVSSREATDERLLSWPNAVGANLGYQATDFQKIGLGYQLRFDAFIRDRSTPETYRPPVSTSTHGLGTTYEYRRGGYTIAAAGTWFVRAAWRPWGYADRPQSSSRDYLKYQASLTKDVYLGPLQKLHVNAAYFGGERLDRFSRYQFGLFDDTRIHGVPASGVRFDELAMARLAYSFNLLDQYRLDVFLDRAYGRSPAEGSRWQPLTGFGTAVNLRAPFRTMLRADVGKSLLPPSARGIGSFTVQVLLLKPL